MYKLINNKTYLFIVKLRIGEGCHVQVTLRWEHLSIGCEPLLCVQKRLEHAFVEEHVAHRLRDDNVNLFGY